MKSWSFITNNNPNEISNKLESALGTYKGFVFNINRNENNSITFKIRKRVLYAWYMIFQNWTIVNGKLLKTDTENKTNVDIYFTQHFLITLIIFTHILLVLGCLISIFLGKNNETSIYILGGLFLALGIIIWIAIQKKFHKDINKYKTLISEILES